MLYKFLSGIFKHGVKVFKKSGMDFQFEHIKAQHTGIWCLLVQCFLGQCSVWTTFGKQILLGHFQLRSESLGAERYEDLIQTYQSTTYWNLVTNREVFAGQGSVWTRAQLLENNLFWGHFQIRSEGL